MTEHPGIPPVEAGSHTPEVYRQAEEVMTRLLPRYADVVRTAAGRTDLTVMVAPGAPTAMTDGAYVIVPVDPAMAGVDPRNPCRCDDESDECAYHRTIGLLLHEAAHISEGSTRMPDRVFATKFISRVDDHLAKLPKEFVDEWVEKHTGFTAGLFANIDHFSSALEVCQRINYLSPFMANAFEDARINLAVGDRRSALEQQMRRMIDEALMSMVDGFKSNPVGHQVGAAIEVKLEHGLDIKPMMNSQTGLNVLNDPHVKSIIEHPMTCTAEACANAVVLVEYARSKYGLFKTNPEEGRTGRRTTTGSDSGPDGLMTPSQQRRDEGEMRVDNTQSTQRAARNAAYEAGEGRPRPPSQPDAPEWATEARNEALQALREEMNPDDLDDLMTQPGTSGIGVTSGKGNYQPVILRPNFNHELQEPASGQAVHEGLTYPAGGEWPQQMRAVFESYAGRQSFESQRRLADALGMNRRSANVPNLVRGRLHGSKLARVPTGNRRAFRRVEKPSKRSYACLIGVDLSGSTSGSMLRFLKSMAYAQAEMLDSIGVPFAVCGHTGGEYPNWTDDETLEAMGGAGYYTTIRVAKNFAEPWDSNSKSALAAFRSGHCNIDGVTMRTYINMLSTQRATDRILLYYTDGAMPAEDHEAQVVILKAQCRRAKAMAMLPDRRLHVVGIAANNDEPKEYGLDTIVVDSGEPDKGVAAVVDGLAERIQKTIK